MGKSTFSMAMFNSYVTNYQRVDDVPMKKTTKLQKRWDQRSLGALLWS